MRTGQWLCAIVSVTSLLCVAAGPAATTRPYEVRSKLETWRDAARGRDVPVKIYWPAEARGRLPVVIFSHGLGGSREGYRYIGEALASHGYVVIHPSHVGSDTDSLLKAGNPLLAAARAAVDPSNIVNRPKDVSFVIDQLAALDREDPGLKGRIDQDKVGVAGHSFGAYTVMACIGERFDGPGGTERTFTDKRIKAAVAMSSPTPVRTGDLDRVYGEISVPCLHMTGTLDDLPFSNSKAEDRRIPFDHAKCPDTFLVTFKGADHMTFSGHLHRRLPATNGTTVPITVLAGTGGDPALDAVFHPLIAEAVVGFFDAYLKRDEGARQWLMNEFPRELGGLGVFERKGQAPPRFAR